MSKSAIPYISEDEVYAACTMKQAIESMRAAFAELSSGEATVPVRTHIPLQSGGDALFMPAYSPALGRHAIKVASVLPDNPERGLDRVQATVIHFDADTGEPVAILEGKSVTAIRTGAGSGLATDLLARDDASIAVVIGSGRQAETQLEAVCCVRKIQRAYCMSRREGHAARFANKMSRRLELDVRASSDRRVLRDADVICTATTATTPILDLDDVKPGVHINAVGTHRPNTAEIGQDLVRASRLFVDHRPGCLKEAGDILIPISTGMIAESHIVGELGEVVSGRVNGRLDASDVTLFKSVGNAIQDLYLAEQVVKWQMADGKWQMDP
ncbi:MAG TPA: ornithine cyclodeaminase family protein [Rhodothermia bacterium]|nr:ornithine cyclodeaminase family protein [Rhodothermia bacterium]